MGKADAQCRAGQHNTQFRTASPDSILQAHTPALVVPILSPCTSSPPSTLAPLLSNHLHCLIPPAYLPACTTYPLDVQDSERRVRDISGELAAARQKNAELEGASSKAAAAARQLQEAYNRWAGAAREGLHCGRWR